jgi:hypothetical protein
VEVQQVAISVDWNNKIITVPKTSTILVQSVPTEIRTLDINTFRLTLRDLEDDDAGMPWPRTHNHIAPISVGAFELARVIEIVNDYTITFEDGQYAVNLLGANSNIADRVNVNQVSVRSANSAGLIQAGTALSISEQAMLMELWRLQGLDATNPLIVDPDERTAGTDINQTITKNTGTDTVTVTRDAGDPVPGA